MIRFLYSFIYFSSLFLRKKYFDVVFYTPTYFNRGENGENLYFKHLIDACVRNNLSYIVFDEPSNTRHTRSNESIPFDFVYYLIIILRKFMNVKNDTIQTDNNIGNFLSNTFFLNFQFANYIVLSQSMLSIFSRIDKSANMFDLQHGIIYTNKTAYFSDNILSQQLKRNNVSLLLNGDLFKQILINNGDQEFILKKSHVIGVKKNNCIFHESANKNVARPSAFSKF